MRPPLFLGLFAAAALAAAMAAAETPAPGAGPAAPLPEATAALADLRAAGAARAEAERVRSEGAAAAARTEVLLQALNAARERAERETAAAREAAAAIRRESAGAASAADAERELNQAAAALAARLDDALDAAAARSFPGAVAPREKTPEATPSADAPGERLRVALARLEAAEKAAQEWGGEIVSGELDGEETAVRLLRAGNAAAWWLALDGSRAGTAVLRGGRLVLLPAPDADAAAAIARAVAAHDGAAAPDWIPLPLTVTPATPKAPEATTRTKAPAPVVLDAPAIPRPVPGRRTIRNFLLTALQPVGRTLYVWGGGWDQADKGSGPDALAIGVSPRWARFCATHADGYDYKQFRYRVRDGLDCSGYVGWAVFNALHDENADTPERLAACTLPGTTAAGYVHKSSDIAKTYANAGLGDFAPAAQTRDWRAGDVMSMKGHVWIVVGACADGSVVLIHSSPPGVRLCGTKAADGGPTLAIALAEERMRRHWPRWARRWPECAVPRDHATNPSYLAISDRFRWHAATLADPEGLTAMDAAGVLRSLLGDDGAPEATPSAPAPARGPEKK